VGASSNRACATCVATANGLPMLSRRYCGVPVETGEAHPSLLEHRSSDGIVAAGRLPIATEGYGSLIQRRIVVVVVTFTTTRIDIEGIFEEAY
jgi:hypothetical protein